MFDYWQSNWCSRLYSRVCWCVRMRSSGLGPRHHSLAMEVARSSPSSGSHRMSTTMEHTTGGILSEPYSLRIIYNMALGIQAHISQLLLYWPTIIYFSIQIKFTRPWLGPNLRPVLWETNTLALNQVSRT